MKRNLKAVTPAGTATPEAELNLDTLERAVSEAHCALLAPKSILDLLSAHDLTTHTSEVYFAIERLVDAADEKLTHVEDLVAQLRAREQRA